MIKLSFSKEFTMNSSASIEKRSWQGRGRKEVWETALEVCFCCENRNASVNSLRRHCQRKWKNTNQVLVNITPSVANV